MSTRLSTRWAAGDAGRQADGVLGAPRRACLLALGARLCELRKRHGTCAARCARTPRNSGNIARRKVESTAERRARSSLASCAAAPPNVLKPRDFPEFVLKPSRWSVTRDGVLLAMEFYYLNVHRRVGIGFPSREFGIPYPLHRTFFVTGTKDLRLARAASP